MLKSQHQRPVGLATLGLRAARSGFVAAFAASAIVNVLVLAASLFSIQVYDRVLPARSLSTLASLVLLLLLVVIVQAMLEGLRARLLSRIGEVVDADVMPPVVRALRRQGLARAGSGDGMQPLRDADNVRLFLAGAGPMAILDLPWLPLFLVIMFLLHPVLGSVTLVGALVLVGMLLVNERLSRDRNIRASEETAARNASAEVLRRDAETMAAMGLAHRFEARFLERHGRLGATQLGLADVGTTYGALGRMVRQVLQSAIIAAGAWLVIENKATIGVMFAASILAGRTLAPLETAIAHWRQLQAARQSLARLDAVLAPAAEIPTALPAPASELAVKGLRLAAPGSRTATLVDIDFTLRRGEVLVVAGPSGAGKSTLARGLLGIWPKAGGEVRLDGAEIGHWSEEARGQFTGYLPQTVELYEGTIAENIARFAAGASAENVVAAAQSAGAHDMILSLPQGYDTVVGPNGVQLSGGQRQRIGLARALYGKPFLIVLDEPNAALDGEGEAALMRAIDKARKAGAIVIVVAHRAGVLGLADRMLLVKGGRQVAFGPPAEVMEQVRAAPRPGSSRPQVVAASPADAAATAA